MSALLLALSAQLAFADVTPTASFIASANYGVELPVQFDAGKSEDPDGKIVRYSWKFGDGSEGSGVAPAHTYAATGTYEVTLIVEDDAHLEAMTTQSVAVRKSQKISFTSTPPGAAVVGGATYTVEATATSVLQVSFSSGTPAVCAVSVSTVSFIGAGTCTVLADQQGNNEFAQAVQRQQSFAVGKGTQNISFTSAPPGAAAVGGATYTVEAAATSGLPVSLSSGTPGACAISGATVSFIGVGTCTILANQPGNENYEAAAQQGQSFAVGKGTQKISFTSTPPGAAVVGGATYTVGATATSGLPVLFSSGTPAVCAVSGSTVSFVGVGTCTVLADQGGSGNYNAAAQAAQSFAVRAVRPSAPNSNFGGHASYNTRTGAITVNVTVSNPGRFTWRATFANGKFGVFASARSKCRHGQLRLNGKCRPAAITFGKGVTNVTGAGPVTFVIKPSRSATRALKSRAGRKKGVPVSLSLRYQSSLGGAPVSHTASLTVKLKG